MKIYTKTGDRGQTSLYNGTRCDKSHDIVYALGDLDELNVALGAVGVAHQIKSLPLGDDDTNTTIMSYMQEMQRLIMDISTNVALARKPIVIDYEAVLSLMEKYIDWMTHQLPELTKFIIPGSCIEDLIIHQARTICRRAERAVIAAGGNSPVLNRLSDFLFTLARYVVAALGFEEILK